MYRFRTSSCSFLTLAIIGSLLFSAHDLSAQSVTLESPDAKKQSAESYIRLERDANEAPQALQTATVQFVSGDGKGELMVDLIGVVHVGDKKYYEQFNKAFKQYEVLLYELVAPEGTRVPEGGRGASANPLAMLQGLAQSVLGLASQLDHVDYSPKNFVHADMSPADMAAALKKRGATPFTFALRAFADIMDQAQTRAAEMEAQPDAEEQMVDFFSLLTDKNAGAKLKVQLAEQFSGMGAPDSALGATVNQLLIQDRNAAAMKVFQRELAAGRRKIGIFYGAAHMPDFEQRLVQDFGLRREKATWQTAWDLSVEAPEAESSPFGAILQLLQEATDDLDDR